MFLNVFTISEIKEKIEYLEGLKDKTYVDKEHLKELKKAYKWQTEVDLNE